MTDSNPPVESTQDVKPNDFDVVVPEQKFVILEDKTQVPIAQIKVRQLSQVTRLMIPLYDSIRAGGKDAVARAIMENCDAVVAAVAVFIAKDIEWVNDRSLDDLAALLAAVIEVNSDFFVRQVVPLLLSLRAELSALRPAVLGQTPSKP